MVSMSRMCTSPMGNLASTFRISQPMPPTPTTSTRTWWSFSEWGWTRRTMRLRSGVDFSTYMPPNIDYKAHPSLQYPPMHISVSPIFK